MSKDPYCYSGTDVLKNKANIRDKEQLKEFEAYNVQTALADISSFDSGFEKDNYEHLKAIHEKLFGDIYDWAGQERIINIRKEERVLSGGSVEYPEWMDAPRYAQAAINILQKTIWNKLKQEQKAEKFCDVINNLWQAHPFREGNTRAITLFFTNLAKEYGFRMEEGLLAKSSEYLRDALVMGTLGKKEYLYKIVKDSIERGKNLPFENDNEKIKYEKLQVIRGNTIDLNKSHKFLKSEDLFNSYAKKILDNTGNIWRGETTDKEIYKAMLQDKVSEPSILHAIKSHSPSLIGKGKENIAEYVILIKNS